MRGENNTMKSKNTSKGITLVAIVITIIVLMILAIVSIKLSRSSGMIEKAERTAIKYQESKEIEEIKLAIEQVKVKKLKTTIEKEKLQKEIDLNMGLNWGKVYYYYDGFLVSIIKSNRKYKINSDMEVSLINIEIIEDKNPGDITTGINGEELTGKDEKSPYEIWCIEDLLEWSNNYKKYSSSFIKLCTNLDFKSEVSYGNAEQKEYGDLNKDGEEQILIKELNSGIGFTPINDFSGVFDGNKHKISNIYINSPKQYVGLISTVYSSSIIKNLEVSGEIKLTSDNNIQHNSIGGIVGKGNGIIENCINDCNIKYKKGEIYGVGGIAGYYNGKINKCINKGRIEAYGVAGGICGTGDTTIINSINLGAVTGTGSLSGILGGNYWSGKANIYNSINIGDIVNSGKTIYDVSGGIYGYEANNMSEIQVFNCVNCGKIEANWSKGAIIAIIRLDESKTVARNCFYQEGKSGNQTKIATSYSIEYIKSQEFLGELNNFIYNEDGIDKSEWCKWKSESDGYPMVDFDN